MNDMLIGVTVQTADRVKLYNYYLPEPLGGPIPLMPPMDTDFLLRDGTIHSMVAHCPGLEPMLKGPETYPGGCAAMHSSQREPPMLQFTDKARRALQKRAGAVTLRMIDKNPCGG